jgi:hypothetical protein
MFEILGALLGGIFRIFPEVMKFFDAKNERAHELDMLNKQIEFQTVTGKQKMDEIQATSQAAYDVTALESLKEAIKAQGQLTGNSKIDAITQTVRPFATYLLLALYIGSKLGAIALGLDQGMKAADILVSIYNPEDRALLAGILNFWFLSRVFEKSYAK